jgi:hypothetical protein
MRHGLIGLCMLLCFLTPAVAQLSISFGTPGVSIGISLPVYPRLQRIPGYPVYYAPGVSSNYFFYDGMYWVYQGDNWYASSWYDGPWGLVDRAFVPVYLLRVPVRYYRHPPAYFHGWRADHPPRWGEHWGPSWEQSRHGWDSWNRKSAPAPAPLPTYQRQYSGNKYPQASQQAVIQTRNYRYQPKDAVAQQHFQQQRAQAPAAQPQRAAPQQKPQPQRAPVQREQQAPRQQPQKVERQPQQAPAAREQRAPPPQAQERAPKGKGQDKGQGQGREKDNKEKGQ